ncbi:MAG: dihydrolipoyl dehydrogenase [Clostridia bacterium]|nr:dihydrolipoyl dehydrogenase [Clostridia bacterium]
MEYQYDLLVLGGGPAGYSAAIRASQNGLKVALTEQSKVGGTCLNRGCIPTKALLHSAEVLNSARHAQEFGIFVENPSFDLGKIYERRDLVVTKLRTGVEKLLSARKVALFEGQASFVDAHTVKVGDQTVSADKILISTGSVPATLRIEGMDLCVNSDYLLEGTNEIPDNIVIVGGGVIGVEFAEFLLALNKKVTIIEFMDRILPIVDRDVSLQHALALKKKGATICLSAAVNKVIKTENGFEVTYTDKKGEQKIETDLVIVSTGRRANIAGLNAESVGIQTERGCIKVDANYKTALDNVYAVGDCIGGIQLAHFAAAQGEYVADTLAGVHSHINLAVVPSCIYTTPEIACVGMTQAQATEQGIEVEVGKFPMGANGKSLIVGQDRGFVKTVFEKSTGKLLGAVLYCDRATDILGQMVLAVANGMTRDDMEKTIHPHPTVEEGVGESVMASVGKAIHTL